MKPGWYLDNIEGAIDVWCHMDDSIESSDSRHVATLYWSNNPHADNDSRLISAAPDMFEACLLLVEADKRALNTGFMDYRNAVDIARAAIAKAKGKKP